MSCHTTLALRNRCARFGIVVAPAIALCVFAAGCDVADFSDRLDEVVVESASTEPTIERTPPPNKSPETPALPRAAIPSPESLSIPGTLTIGDSAPPLRIDRWVHGTPVHKSLAGGVHVVEFWATWCGPCLRGMPHISELQQAYGEEVAFVGVTREDVPTVERFLGKKSPDGRLWSEVVQYRLATDAGGVTNASYMKAADQTGIPCAFIVGRDGMVEWIGHPARIDDPLRQVVDGTWDREAGLVAFEQQQRFKQLSRRLNSATRARQWDKALEMLHEVEKDAGPSLALAFNRLSIMERAGMDEDASSVRSEIVDLAWDDAQSLNRVAWSIAIGNRPDELELALRASNRASELRDHQDAAILDTLARVHYELGDLDQAVRWQTQAVEHNQGQEEIEAALKRYLNEKRRVAAEFGGGQGKAK